MCEEVLVTNNTEACTVVFLKDRPRIINDLSWDLHLLAAKFSNRSVYLILYKPLSEMKLAEHEVVKFGGKGGEERDAF